MKHLILSAAILFTLTTVSQASPIAYWDIANGIGTHADGFAMDDSLSVSGLDVTGATALNPSWGYSSSLCARNWSEDMAIDEDSYYEFSVTPDEGMGMDFDTLTLALARGHYGGNHGAQMWDLRTSVDGFSSTLLSYDLTDSSWDEQILFADSDISSLGTQYDTVTFRLYGYDDGGSTDYSGLANWSKDSTLTGTGSNVVIGGSVVPEPTALAMLLPVAALALRKKR